MTFFTDGQKKIIACGLTCLSFLAIVGVVASIGWCLIKLISFAAPALFPLITGLFLAMLFKPYYLWWLKIVKTPSMAVALMLVSLLLPVVIVFYCFGSFIYSQVYELIIAAPNRIYEFTNWFNNTCPKAKSLATIFEVPYENWVYELKMILGKSAISVLGYSFWLLSALVSLIFFVYFITKPRLSGEHYVREMPYLKPETRDFVSTQIDVFLDIVVGFFQRQMLICLVEGFLYGLGFYIVGLPYGFLLGFMLGFLNFVPLLGTVLILPIALILAYWGKAGSPLLLTSVTCVWLVGQFLDGYLITPKIQGDKTGIGYAGVIFSFFFWGIVFDSFLGLLFAIPLSAFCLVLWRGLKEKYIKPIL